MWTFEASFNIQRNNKRVYSYCYGFQMYGFQCLWEEYSQVQEEAIRWARIC